MTYLKNIVIKKHHDDARDIKGPQRRVDDVVGVVEQALVGASVWGVVEAQDYRGPNGSRHEPGHADHKPNTPVAFVFRVFDWLRYCYVPVNKISMLF